jgi:hypothetical protein
MSLCKLSFNLRAGAVQVCWPSNAPSGPPSPGRSRGTLCVLSVNVGWFRVLGVHTLVSESDPLQHNLPGPPKWYGLGTPSPISEPALQQARWDFLTENAQTHFQHGLKGLG